MEFIGHTGVDTNTNQGEGNHWDHWKISRLHKSFKQFREWAAENVGMTFPLLPETADPVRDERGLGMTAINLGKVLASEDVVGGVMEMLNLFELAVPIPGLGLGMKAIRASAYYLNSKIGGCPKKTYSFCNANLDTQYGPPQMDFGLSTYEYIMQIQGNLTEEGQKVLEEQRRNVMENGAKSATGGGVDTSGQQYKKTQLTKCSSYRNRKRSRKKPLPHALGSTMT